MASAGRQLRGVGGHALQAWQHHLRLLRGGLPDGLRYKNVVGTYLHGPLLPKNPQVCDLLLRQALERKCGDGSLAPLPDVEEREANEYIVKRFVKKLAN